MLTPKQKAFADFYIDTGNATEAARRAGYSKKNIGENAAKTLKNTKVSAYIQTRLAEIDAGRIATADEVMKVFSSILRGTEVDQDGLTVSVHDRIDAGKAIMRRIERIESQETSTNMLTKAEELLGTIGSVIR